MTISEVIRQYERDAAAVKRQLEKVREQRKADKDPSHMADYRRREELLYEEHADMMYVIGQLLRYREREAELMGSAAGE